MAITFETNEQGEQVKVTMINGATVKMLDRTPVPVQPLPTKLEFFDRFTDAEQIAIYDAAKTVTAIQVWLDKFKLASDIDVTDPRTIAGIQALEAAGLLAAGRAAEILV